MLTIITWNVNGVRARQSEVLELIERERPDVLCLQEIKASSENVPAPLVELPDYFGMWHGHKGYSGVALHVARNLTPAALTFDHPRFDHETRIVTTELDDLVFVSTYVPNGGKDFVAKQVFLTELDAFAAHVEQAGKRLVVCGDLNVAREPRDVHPSLQRPEQIGQTEGERSQLERVIGRNLIDLSRQFHPDDDRLFSWWAPWRNMKQKNIGWRLDYVLCSRSLAAQATECTVLREFGTSDHAPVRAKFAVDLPRYEHSPVVPVVPVVKAAPKPEAKSDRESQLNLFDA
ncbi:MAG TPA: exodeoxyribonuclease III [Polyangiales bacterium]|nr:exodeoxyribonuclease III [Polyangiales bacterium]